MDIMELGAVGELVGGLAVIGSLLYVGMQIRKGSISENARAFESVTYSWDEGAAHLLDPSNTETFLSGCQSYSTLNPSERLRFTVLAIQFLDRFDAMLHLESLGVIDRGLLSGYYGNLIRDFMQNPGFRAFWQDDGNYFSPRLRRWVVTNCPGTGDPHEVGALANLSGDRSREEI